MTFTCYVDCSSSSSSLCSLSQPSYSMCSFHGGAWMSEAVGSRFRSMSSSVLLISSAFMPMQNLTASERRPGHGSRHQSVPKIRSIGLPWHNIRSSFYLPRTVGLRAQPRLPPLHCLATPLRCHLPSMSPSEYATVLICHLPNMPPS